MATKPVEQTAAFARGPVADALEQLLADHAADLRQVEPSLDTLGERLHATSPGPGGLVRAELVGLGARVAGADPVEALWPAVAVELLHRHALVHDEVWRRPPGSSGAATAFAGQHRQAGLVGDLPWQGVGGAILTGDLLLVWVNAVIDRLRCAPPVLDDARRLVSTLRSELLAGQFLDLRSRFAPSTPVRTVVRTVLLKVGRYTIGRPLQLGALVAGAPAATLEALGRFGASAGMVVQLRRDLCRACGHPRGDALADDLGAARTNLVLADVDRLGRLEPSRALHAQAAQRERAATTITEVVGPGELAQALVGLMEPDGALAAIDGPACRRPPCAGGN